MNSGKDNKNLFFPSKEIEQYFNEISMQKEMELLWGRKLTEQEIKKLKNENTKS